MTTYFEETEEMLRKLSASPSLKIVIGFIREAMIKDQHRLFHDAEFHDGCTICDKERASE